MFYNITGLIHDNGGCPTNSPVKANRQGTRIMKKVENNLGDIEKYESYRLDDAQVCVVSFGGTARSARAAVDAAQAGAAEAAGVPGAAPWADKRVAEGAKSGISLKLAMTNNLAMQRKGAACNERSR